MEKHKIEFSKFCKEKFNIDVDWSTYRMDKETDLLERFHFDDDEDGAITLSAMWETWKYAVGCK